VRDRLQGLVIMQGVLCRFILLQQVCMQINPGLGASPSLQSKGLACRRVRRGRMCYLRQ
jgi:hypothetical protein